MAGRANRAGVSPASLGVAHEVQVDPRSGALSVSVPFEVTEGRGSLTPQLGLSYLSGGSNGVFGRGWGMNGLMSVSVHTAQGLPRYDGRDTYSFAGAGELVPHEGGWEDRGAFRVLAYLARTERAFLRIESWVEKVSGLMHWRSRDARGTLTVYGLNPDGSSRIADPEDTTRIFMWLPELQIDASGNAIRFVYAKENYEGVDRARPEEAGRIRAGKPPAQRYLKEVLWGNTLPISAPEPEAADQKWSFQLVFDYGDHANAHPVPDQVWPVRADAFSSFSAGFDLRTYRFCRRVMLFHDIPALSPQPVLVQDWRLTYDLKPEGGELTQILRSGYRLKNDGTLTSKSRPPLTFTYTKPRIGSAFLPAPRLTEGVVLHGLEGARYRLVDLYGEGLPGLLAEGRDVWTYRHNEGGGRFGAEKIVLERPAHAVASVAVQDFDGDGNVDLVVTGSRKAGYYAYDRLQERWAGFTPFQSVPHVDAHSHKTQWLDLDGDGQADLLIGGPDRLTVYPSKGREGFGPGQDVQPMRAEEVSGFSAPWRDLPEQYYLFADMTGDGLSDQLLVRDGCVVYWPNLGHGRFGAPITMDNAPHFSSDGAFDTGRLLFADLDGSGTTDLLYLGTGEITFWINAGGNRFLPGQTLRGLPVIDKRSVLRVLDFLGDGTPCLVWSSSSGTGAAPLHYLPLTDGVKPGLILEIQNGMGLKRRISYSTSGLHYLRDKAEGRDWRRKLPRHSIVVDRLELTDEIGGARFESLYRYHDGSYDGRERRFRGFGFVEIFDADLDGAMGVEAASTAPSCTRMWFHLGADGVSSRDLMWAGDPSAPALTPHLFESGEALLPEEAEDALLAVSGMMVRSEVFAVREGKVAPHPYQVMQSGALIRRVQAVAPGRKASFAAFSRESLSYLYEENPDDPRIMHQLALAYDAFGVAILNLDLAYPRRLAIPPVDPAQSITHAHLTRLTLAHDSDAERSIALEAEDFDIAGLPPPAGGVFTWEAAKVLAKDALAGLISHDAPPAPGQARRTAWARTFYWNAAGNAVLPFGQHSTPLRIHHVENAVFTSSFAASQFGTKIDAAKLGASFYRLELDHWWRVGEIFHYGGAEVFRRLERIERSDGGTTRYVYDAGSLIVVQSEDAAGNQSQLTIDYHLMAPSRIEDENGVLTEVLYDPLGVPIATSRRGEVLDGNGAVQVQGFALIAAFAPPAGADIETVLADPAGHVGQMANAIYYDLDRWTAKGEPPVTVSLTRENFVHDGTGAPPAAASVLTAVSHIDGFGRPLQQKIRVESGPAVIRGVGGALVLGGDGRPVLSDSVERWLVSPHIVYNRKQQPVRTYEPFHSSRWHFEREAELAQFGIFTSITYDAMGRAIRQDQPNGTYSKTEYAAWVSRQYDANDTVGDSLYRIVRQGLAPSNPQRRALDGALAHKDTPVIAHVDALGRTVLVTESDGAGGERRLRSRYGADGALVEAFDPRGLSALRVTQDMLGRVIRKFSVDAGEQIMFTDGLDRSVESWSANGAHRRVVYDRLDRPVAVFADGIPGLDRQVEAIVYGDDPIIANAAWRHLRGRPAIQRDEAGMREILRCSIDGLILETTQRIIADPKTEPDWRAPVALVPESFTSKATYDAMGRMLRQDLPDGTTLTTEYQRGGGLRSVAASSSDGVLPVTPILQGAEFDAHGQRTRITLGNGISIQHLFDPETRKTVGITALRPAGVLPAATLQDIAYTYDPVGNVVLAVDRVHQPGAPSPLITGHTVSAERAYRYDAFYRLREATGRVHRALLPSDHRTDVPNPGSFKGSRRLSFNDGGLLERYTQRYAYDASGNMTQLVHAGANANWTTDFWVSASSNRSLPALGANGIALVAPETQFDASGNALCFPYLAKAEWSWRNTLQKAVIIDRSADAQPDDVEYYAYDSAGRRVRKRTERLIGAGIVEATDIFYLDGCEIKRVTRGATLILDRRTAHVSDGFGRIALLHRWIKDDSARETDDIAKARIRYQIGDHLGSAHLQLDEQGGIISYEEYLPFGGTAFIAGNNTREVEIKTYRFCAKERDDATGLYYFGHRYYAPWMCRWISADPAGQADGLNLYLYVHNNPATFYDPNGLQTAQARGREVDVAGAVPLSVQEAFAALPEARREELRTLMRQGTFRWFRDGTTGQVYFGTLAELRPLVEAKLRAGENVGVLHPPSSSTGLGGGHSGGGTGSGSRPRRRPRSTTLPPTPPAPPQGSGTGASSGAGPNPGSGSSSAATGPGGGPGGATGTGNSSDPGGSQANPGDGGEHGATPGTGSGSGGTGGNGPGLGAQGTGTGGGGTADGATTLGSGAGQGNGSGSGTGDAHGDGTHPEGHGTGEGSHGEGTGQGTGQNSGEGNGAQGHGTGQGTVHGGNPNARGQDGSGGTPTGGQTGTTGQTQPDPNSDSNTPPDSRPGGTSGTGSENGQPGNVANTTGDPSGRRTGATNGQSNTNPAHGQGQGSPQGTATQPGGEPGGNSSGGRGPREQPTIMDRITTVAGYWNLEFSGDPNGRSGGIPGGFGSHNWGGWGQALYLALTVADIVLTFVSLGGYAGIKAGLKAGWAATKRLITSLGRKLAVLVTEDVATKALSRASIKALLQGAGQAMKGVGGRFWRWFNFLGDAGGVTTRTATQKIFGFWSSHISTVTNLEVKGSAAFIDTAVHEGFHKFVGRFLGPVWDLGELTIKGRPVGAVVMWAEETVAYGLGHASVGRLHGLVTAPIEAFGSVFSNFGGGALGSSAVRWAVGELALIGTGIGAYFYLHDEPNQQPQAVTP